LFLGLILASVAGVVLLLPERPVVLIDSQSSDRINPRAEHEALRFAVASVLSPEGTAESYRSLGGWLGERVDRPVRLVQRRTYGEINGLLEQGSVDIALVCTGAYLRGVADGLDVEPLVIPVPPHGPNYWSLTIVRRDSDFKTFDDVAAGRMAFTDPLSLSGHLYPLALALKRGHDPGEVLGRAIHTYSHDGSLHAVADGLVDGAAVDSLVWDWEVRHDSEVTGELRIVHRSAALAIQPVVVPRSLDPEIRDGLRSALLALDDSDEGREILRGLGLRSFDEPSPEMYRSTEELITPLLRHFGEAG